MASATDLATQVRDVLTERRGFGEQIEEQTSSFSSFSSCWVVLRIVTVTVFRRRNPLALAAVPRFNRRCLNPVT